MPLAARKYVPPTHGPVTAKEIYYLLLQKGMSSAQAEGVMANMWAESKLDPESDGVDSNGYRSVGVINWNTAPGNYPHAGSLVTGNPQQDIRAQIDYLFTGTNGIKAGLSGATAADVAGNWATNVEGCQGCASGDTTTPNGWGARRGYASMFTQAASSGNWANIKTSLVGVGQNLKSGTAGPGGGADCLVGWQGVKVPVVGSVGNFCLVSKSQGRAIFGGAVLGLACLAALPILAIAVVAIGGRTKAGQAIGRAGGSVLELGGGATAALGAPEVGAPLAAAGGAIKSGNIPGRASGFARNARAADRKQRAADDAAAQRDRAGEIKHQDRMMEREIKRSRRSSSSRAPIDADEFDKVPF